MDAMGGDYAPRNIIEGAALALKAYPEIEKLFLVGETAAIKNELKGCACADTRVEICHASEVISMKDSAAKAVRHKKDSSICRAVDLVKTGTAEAVVSAGHTGAAVAACVLKLRTLKGIERPAVACLLPTASNVFVLIDAGANPDSTPENLFQFAIMGSVFSEHVLGYKNPSVALMSIGEEDMKGNDVTKEAFKLLKSSGLNFRGNIEGHDLFESPSEVVVCDGFTGNVMLKTAEGAAGFITAELRDALVARLHYRLASAILRPALVRMRRRFDYAEYGAAPLLGVRGVVMVAHGRSDSRAIANALRAARDAAQSKLCRSD